MKERAGNRLTMREAGAYLDHSYSWMVSNHRSMGLNGYRIGGRWYFDIDDLKEWELLQRNQAAQFRKSNNLNRMNKGVVSFV